MPRVVPPDRVGPQGASERGLCDPLRADGRDQTPPSRPFSANAITSAATMDAVNGPRGFDRRWQGGTCRRWQTGSRGTEVFWRSSADRYIRAADVPRRSNRVFPPGRRVDEWQIRPPRRARCGVSVLDRVSSLVGENSFISFILIGKFSWPSSCPKGRVGGGRRPIGRIHRRSRGVLVQINTARRRAADSGGGGNAAGRLKRQWRRSHDE